MTVKQYDRLIEAKAAGDESLMEQIRNEKYGEDSTIIDVEIEFSDEAVLDDLAAGIDRSEIMSKYGITTQKISAIVKKAK